MMNDSVAKIPSEDFPFHRLIHDESNRLSYTVGSVSNLFIESKKIRFIVEFEGKGIDCVSFIPTTFVVCLEEFS